VTPLAATRLLRAGGPAALALLIAALAHPAVAVRLGGDTAHAPLALDRLAALALAHLGLSLGGALAAALAGLGLGIAATRAGGAALRPLIDAAGAGAQAVPPVVVVALALPVLGFGPAPTLIALFAYSLLPVLRGTVGALETVPEEAREAARGLGMTPAGVLLRVELPLAAPAILSSLRTALVLAVATAAVGALAGAATLGTPIITGLQNQNGVQILQGAAATAALAFGLDAVLLALDALLRRGAD
jgi:osmoprotectant transport system permease protein